MSRLTLYVDSLYTSPYAMSAFVTLTEKALPFELRTVDLEHREHHSREYSATSLTCRVPTLLDGDFNLSESSAICEYLEERFAPPEYAAVYPVGLRQRARARQLQAWLRSDFMPIRQERSTEVIFMKPVDQPLSDDAKAAAAKLFQAADALLPDGADNLFGDWSIADTDLALMLNRLVMNGDEVPAKLARYAQQQWLRPSVQQWVALSRWD